MSKFFLITGCLIICLLLIFLIISYVSPFSLKQQKTVNKNSPQTILYFKPNPVYSPCNGTGSTVTIYINTYQNLVNSAQIELLYDPHMFYNVNLTPAPNNFLGKDYNILLMEVREEYGRATLAIEENHSRTSKKGNSAIATLSFQTFSNESSKSGLISFLNKSTATNDSSENSLLKEARPLEVICASH